MYRGFPSMCRLDIKSMTLTVYASDVYDAHYD